jgi:perosamine synthetase
LLAYRKSARFPGDSNLSEEGTARWLEAQLLELDDRILFFVQDPMGRKMGHVGLWRRNELDMELDNIIKNPVFEAKGVMSEAVKAIGRWAREFIGVEKLTLRVSPTNVHAIKFYSRLGFEVSEANETWQTMSVLLDYWFKENPEILTAGPSIGPLEQALVGEAVRTGWNYHFSDFLSSFADTFGTYEDAEYVIPTDSCTSALHLALWALGIGPGDEVIVPEITWVATATAVRYVGATPIFADVDQNTWCLDPSSVREKITPSTRAVMPVHLYGFVSELDQISNICSEFGLYMVQDAAPGIGTMLHGKSITNWGDISCFSFQGAKLLVSGEGGALVTKNRDIYAKALKLSQSGRKPGTFWIEQLGKKITMGNPTAALALAQVFGVERQINKKVEIASWYRELLGENPMISFQKELVHTRSIHWLTSIRIETSQFDRDEFRRNLLTIGIDTRPVFPPISSYPIWTQKYAPNPNAVSIGGSGINLPSGVRLTRFDIERVSEGIQSLL